MPFPEERRPGAGRAWIQLNMDHLRHNVSVLRNRLPPGCRLMPVVKADAYGHGAVLIAGELNRLGIHAFCVATAGEGAELREHGIQGDILILGYTPPEDTALLVRYDLIQTIVDYQYAQALDKLGLPLRVHVGIDTGMHRLGQRCEEPDRIWRHILDEKSGGGGNLYPPVRRQYHLPGRPVLDPGPSRRLPSSGKPAEQAGDRLPCDAPAQQLWPSAVSRSGRQLRSGGNRSLRRPGVQWGRRPFRGGPASGFIRTHPDCPDEAPPPRRVRRLRQSIFG